MIEQPIQLLIGLWNDCLMRGEHGRVLIRIGTYGTADQEEGLGKSSVPSESSDDDDPKHAEPGTAFAYEEWKEGKNAKSIVDQAVWEGLPVHSWSSEGVHECIDTDHECYSISLQERFLGKRTTSFSANWEHPIR